MTDWISGFAANSFSRLLLDFDFNDSVATKPDLFSRGCVEFFQEHDFEIYGYQFTQIFEENVLNEVIVLNGLQPEDVYSFRQGASERLERLRALMSKAEKLSEVALANTIAALVSLSRFRAALPLMNLLRTRTHAVRGAFELGWLEFLISNRFADGRDSVAAFDRMRAAVESGAIPAGRILDICTQGVVWHIKRREVDNDTFKWCLTVGTRLAHQTTNLDFGAISSWYRGLAMLPAARRNPDLTREYMERARDTASLSVDESRSTISLNALKTYYESSIKEFLYIRPDRALALDAAQSLIALDPVWAPSYGECADIHSKFGDHEMASHYYERAAALGPPYFGHHLLMAARSRARDGDASRAQEHYAFLLQFAPDDVAIREEAGRSAMPISNSHAHSNDGHTASNP